MAIVEFRYDPKNTAWFTANAAMVLKAGEPAYHDTTGLFKLGDGVTALSALSFLPIVSSSTPTIQQVLTAGQVATTTIETTGFIKTGGTSSQFLKADGSVDSSTYLTTLGTAATSLTTTGSSGAATLISNVLNVPNYTLAGLGGTTLAAVNAQNLSVFAATTSAQLAGVISDETGSGALVFGTSPTFTTNITTPQITGVSGNLTLTNAIQSSGAITQFTFTNAANTNQTATSNIPNFRINGASKQWATGTVANQYWNYLTANTASFVGASTMTNSFGLYVEAATAGTNATITNNWAIGANGDIQIGGNQIVFSAATNAYLRNTVGNLRLSCASGARVAIDADGSLVGSFTSALTSITTTTLNLSGTTTIAGDTTINSAVGSSLTVTSAVRNAGVRTLFTLTGSADINQTSATEVNRILWTTGSKTWATGNITNQREFLITSPTYNFNGASTITNSYTMFVNAPIAGTNATITNNYALGLAGSLKINDTFNIVFDTTTGTKIATTTTQKLSFWNATPIVQPSAVTTVQGFYDAIASTGLIASGTITLPTGYGRSINNIAINTTGAAAANTDYYYFCTATLTFTLPTAVGNTNTYYIKVTSGTLTINTTSSQTIDGSLTITASVANTAFTLISNGTNWQII